MEGQSLQIFDGNNNDSANGKGKNDANTNNVNNKNNNNISNSKNGTTTDKDNNMYHHHTQSALANEQLFAFQTPAITLPGMGQLTQSTGLNSAGVGVHMTPLSGSLPSSNQNCQRLSLIQPDLAHQQQYQHQHQHQHSVFGNEIMIPPIPSYTTNPPYLGPAFHSESYNSSKASESSVDDQNIVNSTIHLRHDNNHIYNLPQTQPKRIPKWSRNGCLTCKSRKRKCDELRPVCGECQRVNITCIYNNFDDNLQSSDDEHDKKLASNETTVLGLGVVKILRGKVEYKIENGKLIYKA